MAALPATADPMMMAQSSVPTLPVGPEGKIRKKVVVVVVLLRPSTVSLCIHHHYPLVV
jgi:hypothetical protein